MCHCLRRQPSAHHSDAQELSDGESQSYLVGPLDTETEYEALLSSSGTQPFHFTITVQLVDGEKLPVRSSPSRTLLDTTKKIFQTPTEPITFANITISLQLFGYLAHKDGGVRFKRAYFDLRVDRRAFGLSVRTLPLILALLLVLCLLPFLVRFVERLSRSFLVKRLK